MIAVSCLAAFILYKITANDGVISSASPTLKRISDDRSEEDVEDKNSEERKVFGVIYRKASTNNKRILETESGKT